MYVPKNIYIYFYNKLFTAFKEKEVKIKPPKARKDSSPLYWDEISNSRFTELLGGGGANDSRHYYRKLSDVKKLDGIEIDEIAFTKALKYIGVEIPANKKQDQSFAGEDEVNLLYKEFKDRYFPEEKSEAQEKQEEIKSEVFSKYLKTHYDRDKYNKLHIDLLSGKKFWCFFNDFLGESSGGNYMALNQSVLSFSTINNDNLDVSLEVMGGSRNRVHKFHGQILLKDTIGEQIIIKLSSNHSMLLIVLSNTILYNPPEHIFGQFIEIFPRYSLFGRLVLQKPNDLSLDLLPKFHSINREPNLNLIIKQKLNYIIEIEKGINLNNGIIRFLLNESSYAIGAAKRRLVSYFEAQIHFL